MVPKIIHCCWFGGPKTPLAERCQASWRDFAPDWTIREWNESAVERLAENAGIAGLEFFRNAIREKKWAMASDWARMAVLLAEGGLYLDLDSELVAPLDSLPSGEWTAGERTARGDVWMAAGAGLSLEKDSNVARHMLDAYKDLPFDPNREMMPWINERLSETNLRVLDPDIMCPIGVDGRLRATDRTVGIHQYAMSWAGPKQRILKWLSWHGFRWLVDFALRIRRTWRAR